MRIARAVATASAGLLFAGIAASPALAANTDEQAWHLDNIGARAAWTQSQGAGVIVAVLDTGVDSSHPDLAGALTEQSIVGYLAEERRVATSRVFDTNGHGTHVAGIIAGRGVDGGTLGVAPAAKVLPVKLTMGDYEEPGFDWGQRLESVLRSAKAMGAGVVNMSFGEGLEPGQAPEDTATCQALARIADLDLVLVAASGNEGDGMNTVNTPAACPGVLAVGSTEENDMPTTFSTFNAGVGISAPGFQINSTVPADKGSYARMSGTSMASPVVAGVAALVRSAHPDWSAAQVVAHLLSTARDVYAPGADVLTGAGVVDAAAALSRGATPARQGVAIRAWAKENVLHWRPPTAAVASWRVTTAGVEVNLPASAVSYTLDSSLLSTGQPVTVTAVLASGQLVSETVVPLPSQDHGLGAAPVASKVTATWTADGVHAQWVNAEGAIGVSAMIASADTDLGKVRATLESSDSLPHEIDFALTRDPFADYVVTVNTIGRAPGIGQQRAVLPALHPARWSSTAHGPVTEVVADVTQAWASKLTAGGKLLRAKLLVTVDGRATVVSVPVVDTMTGSQVRAWVPTGATVSLKALAEDEGVSTSKR